MLGVLTYLIAFQGEEDWGVGLVVVDGGRMVVVVVMLVLQVVIIEVVVVVVVVAVVVVYVFLLLLCLTYHLMHPTYSLSLADQTYPQLN